MDVPIQGIKALAVVDIEGRVDTIIGDVKGTYVGIGEVHNGALYLRYRSSSKINSAK